jgi:hypothetical protein
MANPIAFSRGGGRSLGGKERTARTDKGYWGITLDSIPVHSTAQRRTWNAIRTKLSGRSGLIAVPAWSFGSAPYVEDAAWDEQQTMVAMPHSDGAPFSDGSEYVQGNIYVEMADLATIGETTIQLRSIVSADDLVGVRFSHRHALYETGPAIDIDGDVWTVPVFPAIRENISAGTQLEFDQPTCLVRMAEDTSMDIDFNVDRFTRPSVSFVEADDYWSDLAAA